MFNKDKNYKFAWAEMRKWLQENYDQNKLKQDSLSKMQSKTQELNLEFMNQCEKVFGLK